MLKLAVKEAASDLHLVVGVPPSLRINGEIIFTKFDALSAEDTKKLAYAVLNENQIRQFEETKELNFSFHLPEIGRFRANIYKEKGYVESAFRIVSLNIKNLDQLGLPEVVKELALRPSGLVLIAGPAGMGKTTTMAGMIDLINETKKLRIITIEDPIEYLHHHKKSIVVQREVGQDVTSDTNSFSSALINALRQDPNVICVGEMRDLDTFSVAMTAAETGHLVLGTIHTPNTIHTISRVVDVFPPNQQQQIRVQLANCLEGVVAQLLLPKFKGEGRVVVTEILIATPAIRHIIMGNKLEQITNYLQTCTELGMHTMDMSLRESYEQGVIDYDTAISKAKDPTIFKEL